MPEWAMVMVTTGVPAAAGLVRYSMRLSFLRYVYNEGGRKDLCVAARAVKNRPVLRRRCSCHRRIAEIEAKGSDESAA
jgi:hypothetical protein